jgi:hypothetical protein
VSGLAPLYLLSLLTRDNVSRFTHPPSPRPTPTPIHPLSIKSLCLDRGSLYLMSHQQRTARSLTFWLMSVIVSSTLLFLLIQSGSSAVRATKSSTVLECRKRARQEVYGRPICAHLKHTPFTLSGRKPCLVLSCLVSSRLVSSCLVLVRCLTISSLALTPPELYTN